MSQSEPLAGVVIRDWTDADSAALAEAMEKGHWVKSRRFRPPFGGLTQTVDVLVFGSADGNASPKLLAYRMTPPDGEDVVNSSFRPPLMRLVDAVAAGGGEPVSPLGFGWWDDE